MNSSLIQKIVMMYLVLFNFNFVITFLLQEELIRLQATQDSSHPTPTSTQKLVPKLLNNIFYIGVGITIGLIAIVLGKYFL